MFLPQWGLNLRPLIDRAIIVHKSQFTLYYLTCCFCRLYSDQVRVKLCFQIFKIQENVRNESEQGILWHFRFETFRTEPGKFGWLINRNVKICLILKFSFRNVYFTDTKANSFLMYSGAVDLLYRSDMLQFLHGSVHVLEVGFGQFFIFSDSDSCPPEDTWHGVILWVLRVLQ